MKADPSREFPEPSAARIKQLLATAIEVLGDEDKSRQWMKLPNRALGGVSPASLIDSDEGLQACLDVLRRVEHGLYS